MSLILNTQPLVVIPELAVRLGLNEAIVLQQLHYWISKTTSGIEFDGKRWVYNSYEQWVEQFPFWSSDTIKRTLTSLKTKGVISVEQLNKSKCDRTNYYAINYSHESLIDSGSLHRSIGANCTDRQGQNALISTENTTETTTEIKDMSVSTKHDGSVSEIFAYWQSAMNSPRSKLGADKKKKILAALKTYSVEEIKKAILGCAMTPFNMGDNDQKTKYNGLELILRNSEKIDKFISHADNPPAARKQKQVIDNNDTSWGKDFGDIY